MTEPHVPLDDLGCLVKAPSFALYLRKTGGQIGGESGAADGPTDAQGAQGVYCADRRILSTVRLEVDGYTMELFAADRGPGTQEFSGPARRVGDDGTSMAPLSIDRVRTARADGSDGQYGMDERIVLTSSVSQPLEVTVRLRVGSDLATIDDVHAGRPTVNVPGHVDDTGLHWTAPGWQVDVSGEDADVDGDEQVFTWRLVVPPGGTAEAQWSVRAHDEQPLVRAPAGEPPWSRPSIHTTSPQLQRLLNQDLDDLDGMRLQLHELPGMTFIAAGTPWFMKLFGRDSLWIARMMLPLGTDLAEQTLRVHAHFQGQRRDERSGEKWGANIHELSKSEVTLTRGESGSLPPRYYGTIDATPLWVILLHDAWRWGMSDDAVRSLLPNLEAAMDWLADADPDGDGFVEYLDGAGLANKGWKDRFNSIQFRDGRLASGPIALCEVQGYAYEAAMDAASLLDAFGRPGGERWREYAARLKAAFRDRFWVEDEHGPYPALALDGNKNRVDAPASNMGHLLGTGILDPPEERLVAARLAAPDMAPGWGLRTLSAGAAGYGPLEYHCGPFWPHDTAIVALGMARAARAQEGKARVDMAAQAGQLACGLLDAAYASSFRSQESTYRLPELYGGYGPAEVLEPVPYPEACVVQGWAAAAGVAALRVLLGLHVDVPANVVEATPVTPCPVGYLHADRLMVGDNKGGKKQLRVDVDYDDPVARVLLRPPPPPPGWWKPGLRWPPSRTLDEDITLSQTAARSRARQARNRAARRPPGRTR